MDRPVWLDYQLCRHNDGGEVRWTWQRTSAETAQLYAELGEHPWPAPQTQSVALDDPRSATFDALTG